MLYKNIHIVTDTCTCLYCYLKRKIISWNGKHVNEVTHKLHLLVKSGLRLEKNFIQFQYKCWDNVCYGLCLCLQNDDCHIYVINILLLYLFLPKLPTELLFYFYNVSIKVYDGRMIKYICIYLYHSFFFLITLTSSIYFFNTNLIAPCNWLRTITSDQYNNSSLSFWTRQYDRNYCEVINFIFVLPGLYLNILKTEQILQFCNKKFAWHVIPAQEVNFTARRKNKTRCVRIKKNLLHRLNLEEPPFYDVTGMLLLIFILIVLPRYLLSDLHFYLWRSFLSRIIEIKGIDAAQYLQDIDFRMKLSFPTS